MRRPDRLAALLLAAALPARAASLEPAGTFRLPDSAPSGLSGVARIGGDRYAFVEDSGGRIHFADVGIDRTTGAPTSCVFRETWTVPGVADGEGIARVPDSGGKFFVSDEAGSRLFEVSGGTAGPHAEEVSARLPARLRTARGNRSLEALAAEGTPDGAALWTAPEDALPCDGPVSAPGRASFVRLCRIAPDGSARAWFVRLPPPPASVAASLFGPAPFNGLCALCPAHDGKGGILALERAYGPTLREEGGRTFADGMVTHRVVLLHPREEPSFDPEEEAPRARPLRETELASFVEADLNFEGMCEGPALEDGSRAVLLVSDGDATPVPGTPFSFQWGKALRTFRLRDRGD